MGAKTRLLHVVSSAVDPWLSPPYAGLAGERKPTLKGRKKANKGQVLQGLRQLASRGGANLRAFNIRFSPRNIAQKHLGGSDPPT